MPTRTVDLPVHLVPGDNCADCAERLKEALLSHRGIADVAPGRSGHLTVTYRADECNLECLTAAATEIGLRLERSFAHINRSIEGMSCYDCARTIESAAGRVEGILSCRVNFPAARMILEYDTAHPGSPHSVERVIEQLGFRLKPESSGPGEPRPAAASGARRWRDEHLPKVITALAAAATMAAALGDVMDAGPISEVLYGGAIALGGFSIARTGVRALLATRRMDINSLMTIAAIGAVAIDAWLEAALVVVLFRIGENLEQYAVDRARRSLESVLNLAPDIAHRRTLTPSGEVLIEDISPGALQPGESVTVRPGEKLPADGVVIEGGSSVNQASITGEPIPVDKQLGAQVFAGTLNGEGLLTVRVTNAPGDSTLDRVTRAVNEAQAQRSPAERWVNNFARIYTPAVLGIAAGAAVVPPVLFGQGWSEWIYRGLAFLILACPCALVIATPVAVVVALARASRAGVLVKGGAYLETATKLKAIATDKTGTLTLGRPFVAEVIALGKYSNEQVIGLAAAVDAASEHPLAQAIVGAARDAGLTIAAAANFESLRGYGARAVVDGHLITVGNERLIADHPRFADIRSTIEQIAGRGATIVAVTSDQNIVGVLGLADRIRPEAADAFADLRRLGIEHTVLLTGDHPIAAATIAAQSGFTDFRANLLPDDKVEALTQIQDRFGPTAMVGDGVNDAPALARSALGIAMGGAGSATAIETADVVLMGDDLRKLGGLVALARAAHRTVRHNIIFALGTKAVAAIFALAGLLPLWLAVMADVGATLVVVANGLRLRKIKLIPSPETLPRTP